jgi:predicted ATPase
VNITLSNPGNSTIEFAVTSNITVPDKFKLNLQPATIFFFQHGPDPGTSPFATVDLPEINWYSNEKVGVVNQTLQLKNLTEFAKLIQQVAYYPTFQISGSTRAKVYVGLINTWVNLYKVVELTGTTD